METQSNMENLVLPPATSQPETDGGWILNTGHRKRMIPSNPRKDYEVNFSNDFRNGWAGRETAMSESPKSYEGFPKGGYESPRGYERKVDVYPKRQFWLGFDKFGNERWFIELSNGRIINQKDDNYFFWLRKLRYK